MRSTWLLLLMIVGLVAGATGCASHQRPTPRSSPSRGTGREQGQEGDDGTGQLGPEPSGSPGNIRDYLARLPKFGPRPTPERITLPSGPEAAWLTHIPTTQPVAFLTIDDGWIRRPEALELVKAAGVPVTLFLTINAIRDNPGYFKTLQGDGAVIEAHTITHTNLVGQSYAYQKHEVCGSADQLGALYGRRPLLFRPPFGNKDATTLKVVHDCGLEAAFFWKETVNNGVVRYQAGNRVQPGDIILMHFRPRFADDFVAALQAIKDAGLTPALLEDYLPVRP
jgi:peptidoglycan/xylan/chitin deacetylase (PgdA/CDA1 family)